MDILRYGWTLTNRYTLILPQSLYQAMLAQAISELPNECCGLLAGLRTEGKVRARQRFPLRNAARQPETEYLSESRSILAAHKAAYSLGRRPCRTRDNELSGKLNCNATPSRRSKKIRNPQSESLRKDITVSEFIFVRRQRPGGAAAPAGNHIRAGNLEGRGCPEEHACAGIGTTAEDRRGSC